MLDITTATESELKEYIASLEKELREAYRRLLEINKNAVISY